MENSGNPTLNNQNEGKKDSANFARKNGLSRSCVDYNRPTNRKKRRSSFGNIDENIEEDCESITNKKKKENRLVLREKLSILRYSFLNKFLTNKSKNDDIFYNIFENRFYDIFDLTVKIDDEESESEESVEYKENLQEFLKDFKLESKIISDLFLEVRKTVFFKKIAENRKLDCDDREKTINFQNILFNELRNDDSFLIDALLENKLNKLNEFTSLLISLRDFKLQKDKIKSTKESGWSLNEIKKNLNFTGFNSLLNLTFFKSSENNDEKTIMNDVKSLDCIEDSLKLKLKTSILEIKEIVKNKELNKEIKILLKSDLKDFILKNNAFPIINDVINSVYINFDSLNVNLTRNKELFLRYLREPDLLKIDTGDNFVNAFTANILKTLNDFVKIEQLSKLDNAQTNNLNVFIDSQKLQIEEYQEELNKINSSYDRFKIVGEKHEENERNILGIVELINKHRKTNYSKFFSHASKLVLQKNFDLNNISELKTFLKNFKEDFENLNAIKLEKYKAKIIKRKWEQVILFNKIIEKFNNKFGLHIIELLTMMKQHNFISWISKISNGKNESISFLGDTFCRHFNFLDKIFSNILRISTKLKSSYLEHSILLDNEKKFDEIVESTYIENLTDPNSRFDFLNLNPEEKELVLFLEEIHTKNEIYKSFFLDLNVVIDLNKNFFIPILKETSLFIEKSDSNLADIKHDVSNLDNIISELLKSKLDKKELKFWDRDLAENIKKWWDNNCFDKTNQEIYHKFQHSSLHCLDFLKKDNEDVEMDYSQEEIFKLKSAFNLPSKRIKKAVKKANSRDLASSKSSIKTSGNPGGVQKHAVKQPNILSRSLASYIPRPRNFGDGLTTPKNNRANRTNIGAIPETPVFETPAFETPAFETPAFETPAFETPAFETPKDYGSVLNDPFSTPRIIREVNDKTVPNSSNNSTPKDQNQSKRPKNILDNTTDLPGDVEFIGTVKPAHKQDNNKNGDNRKNSGIDLTDLIRENIESEKQEKLCSEQINEGKRNNFFDSQFDDFSNSLSAFQSLDANIIERNSSTPLNKSNGKGTSSAIKNGSKIKKRNNDLFYRNLRAPISRKSNLDSFSKKQPIINDTLFTKKNPDEEGKKVSLDEKKNMKKTQMESSISTLDDAVSTADTISLAPNTDRESILDNEAFSRINDEITGLIHKKNDIFEEIKKLEVRVKYLKEELEQKNKDVKETEKRQEFLDNQIQEKRHELLAEEKKIASADTESKNYISYNERLKSEIEKSQNIFQYLENKIKDRSETIKEKNEQYDELLLKISQLQSTFTNLEATINSKNNQLGELNEKIELNKKEEENSKSFVNQATSYLNDLNNEIERISLLKQTLYNKNEEANREIETKGIEVTALIQSEVALKVKLEKKIQEINELENQTKHLENTKKTLEENVGILSLQINNFNYDSTKLTEEQKRVSDDLILCNSELLKCENVLSSKKLELEQAEFLLKTKNDQLTEIENSILEKNKEKKELDLFLSNKQIKQDNAQKEIDELSYKLTGLQKSVRDIQALERELINKMSSLKILNKNLEQKKDDLNQLISKLKQKQDQQTKENEEKIEEQKKELENFKEEINQKRLKLSSDLLAVETSKRTEISKKIKEYDEEVNKKIQEKVKKLNSDFDKQQQLYNEKMLSNNEEIEELKNKKIKIDSEISNVKDKLNALGSRLNSTMSTCVNSAHQISNLIKEKKNNAESYEALVKVYGSLSECLNKNSKVTAYMPREDLNSSIYSSTKSWREDNTLNLSTKSEQKNKEVKKMSNDENDLNNSKISIENKEEYGFQIREQIEQQKPPKKTPFYKQNTFIVSVCALSIVLFSIAGFVISKIRYSKKISELAALGSRRKIDGILESPKKTLLLGKKNKTKL